MQTTAVSFEETKQPSKPIQFKQDHVSATGHLTTSYIVGMLVLVAAIVASWLFRNKLLNQKNQIFQSSESLQVIRRQRLSAKTALYVVQYQDQQLLIAEHSQGVTLLTHAIKSAVDPVKVADDES